MINILMGKSCTGKDTIAKGLKEHGMFPIISYTSRPIRPNEVDGVDYNFISREEFEALIKNDELIEYRSYNTLVKGISDMWYYGLKKDYFDISKDYFVILDVKGAKKFISSVGKKECSVYLLTCSERERLDRAKNRAGYDEIETKRRMEADDIDFNLRMILETEEFKGIFTLIDNSTMEYAEESFDEVGEDEILHAYRLTPPTLAPTTQQESISSNDFWNLELYLSYGEEDFKNAIMGIKPEDFW